MIHDDDSNEKDDTILDLHDIVVESKPHDTTPLQVHTTFILFHSLNGFLVPSTLKITSTIFGKDAIVLINSGSMNNFIQTRWACHLTLPVQPSSHLKVTVGNGEILTCGGECLQVPLQLGEAIFPVDLLLLPVFGTDIFHGFHWFSGLGQILFDYMSCNWKSFVRASKHDYIISNSITCMIPLHLFYDDTHETKM